MIQKGSHVEHVVAVNIKFGFQIFLHRQWISDITEHQTVWYVCSRERTACLFE